MRGTWRPRPGSAPRFSLRSSLTLTNGPGNRPGTSHRHRHFPVQAGASSVWRELMERATVEAAIYQEGVTSLLTPRIYFQAMMMKAFPGLTDEAAEISAADGARAAAELQKMTVADA